MTTKFMVFADEAINIENIMRVRKTEKYVGSFKRLLIIIEITLKSHGNNLQNSIIREWWECIEPNDCTRNVYEACENCNSCEEWLKRMCDIKKFLKPSLSNMNYKFMNHDDSKDF